MTSLHRSNSLRDVHGIKEYVQTLLRLKNLFDGGDQSIYTSGNQ